MKKIIMKKIENAVKHIIEVYEAMSKIAEELAA